MTWTRPRIAIPWLAATAAVGALLGGLLVGYQPVGDDPDQMYRPIKHALAEALGHGTLPFWSDRFGLGVPLVAESHAAAFYPPNLVFYRRLDVATAYRWMMFIHYILLITTIYWYARVLEIRPWGAALAAVSFTLGGFQAIHAIHEPFYHALPYFPLALGLAERYLATGRRWFLSALALAVGAQLTVGHFQLQFWTGGLVVLTGVWRVVADGRPWPRVVGLAGALAWGGAVAAAQLVPTAELAWVCRAEPRPLVDYTSFAYPPAHWAELAIPRLFRTIKDGPVDPYWVTQGATGSEAWLYVGTAPLILACVGWVGDGRNRSVNLWRWVIPVAFILATMPRWWPSGYEALLRVPGLGYFRGPARYTALTGLGLALLAGRGFDRGVSRPRFRAGLVAAVGFGLAALAWGAYWASRPEVRARLAGHPLVVPGLEWAALAWGAALVAVLAWRRGGVGPWAPWLVTAAELGLLYYHSTTRWGWPDTLPERSPVLRRLAAEPGVGRVAGYLQDIPVRAGLTPAAPYLGFPNLPPHPLLEAAKSWEWASEPAASNRLRRFGVTHAIWDGPVDRYLRRFGLFRSKVAKPLALTGGVTLYLGPDPALDRVVPRPPVLNVPQTWRIIRYPRPFPPARAATRVGVAADRAELRRRLSASADPDEVWFLASDLPPAWAGPRARHARVLSWDGASGTVEHDGTCDLVLTQTYYPGWMARVDGGAERPVLRADGGVQAIRLRGSGVSRVSVRYRPTGRWPAAGVSILATGAALIGLAIGAVGRGRVTSAAGPRAGRPG